ncbi:cytochrome c biogenesis protein CcdA, partial [Gordonia alkanivorans]
MSQPTTADLTTTVLASSIGDTFADTVTSGPLLLALAACLLAGLVSFASPCVVPLVPGYLSYLAGLVGAEAPAVKAGEGAKTGRSRVALAAGLFVLGFTVVFVAATATVLGVTST